MPPSSVTCSCVWYSQVGGGQGPPPPVWGARKPVCSWNSWHLIRTVGGETTMPDSTSPTQEEAGRGVQLGMGTPLSPLFLPSAARSNLIPSPPTYNIAHDYISWESFSNVSYYTRVLPSVPQDCPTPMGTKGNGDGVRGLGLGVTGDALFSLGKKQVEEQLLTHSPDGWTKAGHMTYPEPQTRTGLGNEDRKG